MTATVTNSVSKPFKHNGNYKVVVTEQKLASTSKGLRLILTVMPQDYVKDTRDPKAGTTPVPTEHRQEKTIFVKADTQDVAKLKETLGSYGIQINNADDLFKLDPTWGKDHTNLVGRAFFTWVKYSPDAKGVEQEWWNLVKKPEEKEDTSLRDYFATNRDSINEAFTSASEDENPDTIPF